MCPSHYIAVFTALIALGDFAGACMKREVPKRLAEMEPTFIPAINKDTFPDLNITYLTNSTGLNSTAYNSTNNETLTYEYTRECLNSSDSYLFNECRNGGECQVTIMPDGGKTSLCNCGSRFTGSKCQNRYRGELNELVLNNASVYAVATVAGLVFIIVILGVACVIRIKKKSSSQSIMERSDSPGSPLGNSRNNKQTAQQFSLYSSPSHNGDANGTPEQIELLERDASHRYDEDNQHETTPTYSIAA